MSTKYFSKVDKIESINLNYHEDQTASLVDAPKMLFDTHTV